MPISPIIMIYYYSISDFPAIVFLFASTFLSILPPSPCDYLCLPASLFCVHQSTSFIYITVPAKLFLCACFIIHFVSPALLHDFLSIDLVTSFSVCVRFSFYQRLCICHCICGWLHANFFLFHSTFFNEQLFSSGGYTPATVLHGVW